MIVRFSVKNLLAILAVVFLLYVLYNSKQVIIISIFGFLLAYMLSPLTCRLAKRKVPYPLAALIVMVGMVGILVVVSLWIIPKIYADIEALASEMPGYISALMVKLAQIGDYFNMDLSSTTLYNNAMAKINDSGSAILNGVKNVVGSVQYAFGLVMNVVMIPVIAFFILMDYPGLLSFLDKYFGQDRYQGVRKYITVSSEVMAGYFRGQFIVMAILCVLYTIALKIAGVDAAILLGVLTGLLSIVPYLGFAVGIVLSVLFALIQFHDIWHPLYVIIGYAGVQVLESFIITPRIVGHSVGLHPIATIILLLIGGSVFGLVGMIFALPVSAMLFRLYKSRFEERARNVEKGESQVDKENT